MLWFINYSGADVFYIYREITHIKWVLLTFVWHDKEITVFSERDDQHIWTKVLFTTSSIITESGSYHLGDPKLNRCEDSFLRRNVSLWKITISNLIKSPSTGARAIVHGESISLAHNQLGIHP